MVLFISRNEFYFWGLLDVRLVNILWIERVFSVLWTEGWLQDWTLFISGVGIGWNVAESGAEVVRFIELPWLTVIAGLILITGFFDAYDALLFFHGCPWFVAINELRRRGLLILKEWSIFRLVFFEAIETGEKGDYNDGEDDEK